jgi:hypothetical protein
MYLARYVLYAFEPSEFLALPNLYNSGIGPVFITLVIDDQSGGYRLQKSGPLLQKSGAPFLAVELYREKIGVIRILSQAPPLKALELRR